MDRLVGKLVWALVVPLFIFVVPLAAAPERLVHPSPWIGFVAGFLTLVTQPAIGPKTMVTDRGDRFSALAIFAGMILPQVVAIIGFGYRRILHPSPLSPLVLFGFAAVAFGFGLRLWSIRTLGRFFTATVCVQDGQSVVQSGPYRLVRHPSYTGSVLTALGVTIALGSLAGLILVPLVAVPAYVYRIRVEERTLLESLGDAYRAYRSRTWRLLPFVY